MSLAVLTRVLQPAAEQSVKDPGLRYAELIRCPHQTKRPLNKSPAREAAELSCGISVTVSFTDC